MTADAIARLLLIVHVSAGSVGLLAGTVVLVRRKGDGPHRRIGQVFAWGMIATGVSSLILAALRPNWFLFVVGVFTLYLVISGLRALRFRGRNRATPVDWIVSGAMGLAGLAFLAMGWHHLRSGNSMGTVLLVFGVIGLVFVQADLRTFRRGPRHANAWLTNHLQRMVGAYIAAATAFLVVNAHRLPVHAPGFVFWLLPTAVLAPLIAIWSRRHKTKGLA